MKTKNWLQENTGPIIALGFVAFAFFIFRAVLLRQVSASETIVSTIIGSVTNIVMLIVGYYFGSSKSSKDKDAALLEKEKSPTENQQG